MVAVAAAITVMAGIQTTIITVVVIILSVVVIVVASRQKKYALCSQPVAQHMHGGQHQRILKIDHRKGGLVDECHAWVCVCVVCVFRQIGGVCFVHVQFRSVQFISICMISV